MKTTIQIEQLEDRACPVVHSFSAGALASGDNPNAGGSPANAIVRNNLGGIPAPLFAGQGDPPFTSAPGRAVVAALDADRLFAEVF